MGKHVLLVFSNALEGADDEFNHWYTDLHLPDVLKIPGYKSAQRFQLSTTQHDPNNLSPYKYMALYEVETDDLAATATMLASKTLEELPVTEAFDLEPGRNANWWYTPMTDLMVEMD